MQASTESVTSFPGVFNNGTDSRRVPGSTVEELLAGCGAAGEEIQTFAHAIRAISAQHISMDSVCFPSWSDQVLVVSYCCRPGQAHSAGRLKSQHR
jgi:hypothetical protein